MNGRRAKILRGVARGLTVGYPELAYSNEALSPTGNAKTVGETVRGMLRSFLGRRHSGQRLLHPHCTRTAYKALKRELKREQKRA